LWAIAEGNVADFFEPYDAVKRDHTGSLSVRAKAHFRPKRACGRSC
jgi:hypothetical protein